MQDITRCPDAGCVLCRDAIAGGPEAPCHARAQQARLQAGEFVVAGGPRVPG
ncbi:hypothetical protein [Acrocarpospora pleiomorpha]|uniref:hypothetical protein n=1 Tax=Acrocarpospora pleiomorpha TaxID=90975 RepID=UPI0012D30CF3|nr:hypothetical protein [Acrocarpospora pleiomorpha]